MGTLVPQSGRDAQRKLKDFLHITPRRPRRPRCKSQKERPVSHAWSVSVRHLTECAPEPRAVATAPL